MKRTIRLFLILFTLIFFSSCEKIIDLKLSQNEPKMVIEGLISNHPKDCFVYISQTQPFDELGRFIGVSEAEVSITNSEGKKKFLQEIEKGIYYNADLTGVLGETYLLTVKLNNEIYTAQSTMPKTLVKLDSMTVLYNDIYQNYTTSVYFTDPEKEANNYLFLLFKNDKKYNSFFVENDEFTNGRHVKENLPIFSREDEDNIQKGDTIKVQMRQIDANVYTYFYSLNAGALGSTGGPGSFGSPANPVSNINGKNVLGYFSAFTRQVASAIAE